MSPNIRSLIRNRNVTEDSQSNIGSFLRALRQPRAFRTEIRRIDSRQDIARRESDLPKEAEANFDLIRSRHTSDVNLGIPRQDTTPPQEPPSIFRVRLPTDKTFRLRGIPKKWDKFEVQRCIKDRLSLGDNTAVVVRSLSNNPYRHEERVATIEFSGNTFAALEDNAKAEWLIMAEGHELLLDTHFLGMTPLHAADDSSCDVDVIALSGLNGHAFGSFKSRANESTYMWLRDSLPSDIPHARIFIYGYDTQMSNSDCFQNIGDLGQQLKSDLILIRKSTGSSVKLPMILIGHSLGGIMIKSAINKMFNGSGNDQDIAKSICSLLFFGVPNQGMDIESLIPMVESLGRESEVLHNLSQSFQANFDSRYLMMFSFYETKQSPTAKEVEGKWTMSGPPAVLVDRRSATNGRHWEQDDGYLYPVNRTHSEMVKLDNRHDIVYAQALDCLKRVQEISKMKFTILSDDEQECLKSLSFPEQTLRLDQIHTATDTCSWLLQHRSYQAWMNNSSGLLWLEGGPGAGKSVLMKHSLQHLKENSSNDRYLLLSFFIHGQGSQLQRSKLGLLRAILHQVLYQKPTLFSLVLPKYIERCRTMRSWQWSEEELETLLEQCLGSACQSTCVILLVDALDELGEDIALDVVEYFQRLIDLPSKTTLSLRICFSCRHYPAISFNHGNRICVEKENSHDIHRVVGSMLKEVTDSTIASLITKNANGVFQWAVLVSYEARKLSRQYRTPAHIRQKIQDLPKSLHELYSGLLRDAPQATIRLFQWLCFANGSLDAIALRKALAVSIEQSCSSLRQYEEILGFENTENGVSSMVKNLSRGLAKVTRDLSGLRVSLIHQSIRDFLMNGGFECLERSLSVNPEGISNAHLSEACLKFLATLEWAKDLNYYENQTDRVLQTKDFAAYAFYNWAFHAARAEELDYFPRFLLRYFDKPPRYPDREFDDVPQDRPGSCDTIDSSHLYRDNYRHSPPRTTTFIHLLSQNNLRLMIRHLIDRGDMLDVRDGNGRTPLSIAIIEQASNVTKLFLETGRVSPDSQDKYERTPLSYAAQNGSPEEVRFFLASPTVNPNCKDKHGRTPLLYAIRSGRAQNFKASLEKFKAFIASPEVNLDCQDSNGRTPLSYAAEYGWLEEVQALLASPRIHASRLDDTGRPPLSYALKSRRSHVANALLRSSPRNLSHQDYLGRTPLSYAAESGLLEAVKKLISSSNVDPNLPDNEGWTPLLYAVKLGHLEIVKALIALSQVTLNHQARMGITPLLCAVRFERLEIATTLLKSPNININPTDYMGRTPLSYAAELGSLQTVERLIGFFEINLNLQDHRGRTAFDYAREKGHKEVMATLVGNGMCEVIKAEDLQYLLASST